MRHYSISQLAKKFGLSRSTLLYYDTIGLLTPAQRSCANYRIYTEKEYAKLEKIHSLRETGIGLEDIRRILSSEHSTLARVLRNRIDQINAEIKALRFQQNVIVRILNDRDDLKATRILTKETWTALLESAGLDEQGMHQWHIHFEASAPEAHQDFLESLGLSDEEVSAIRAWSTQ